MTRYQGDNAAIGMGVETTFGTAVARANWLTLVGSYSLVETPIITRPRTLRRSSMFGLTAPVVHRTESEIKLNGELQYDFIGPLIRGALGTSSSSGPGPFDHTYAPAYPLPSYTFEVETGNGSDSRVVNGCVSNSLALTFKPGAIASYQSDWIARQVVAPTSKGSPTYATTTPVVLAEHMGATWNSVTLTTELFGATLTIANNLSRSFPVGTQVTALPHTAERKVTCQLELEYGSVIASAFQTAALAGTQSDLVLTITSSPNVMVLTMRNAFVQGNAIPAVGGTGPLMYTVTLEGVADLSDPAIDVVITNASASAVANA